MDGLNLLSPLHPAVVLRKLAVIALASESLESSLMASELLTSFLTGHEHWPPLAMPLRTAFKHARSLMMLDSAASAERRSDPAIACEIACMHATTTTEEIHSGSLAQWLRNNGAGLVETVELPSPFDSAMETTEAAGQQQSGAGVRVTAGPVLQHLQLRFSAGALITSLQSDDRLWLSLLELGLLHSETALSASTSASPPSAAIGSAGAKLEPTDAGVSNWGGPAASHPEAASFTSALRGQDRTNATLDGGIPAADVDASVAAAVDVNASIAAAVDDAPVLLQASQLADAAAPSQRLQHETQAQSQEIDLEAAPSSAPLPVSQSSDDGSCGANNARAAHADATVDDNNTSESLSLKLSAFERLKREEDAVVAPLVEAARARMAQEEADRRAAAAAARERRRQDAEKAAAAAAAAAEQQRFTKEAEKAAVIEKRRREKEAAAAARRRKEEDEFRAFTEAAEAAAKRAEAEGGERVRRHAVNNCSKLRSTCRRFLGSSVVSSSWYHISGKIKTTLPAQSLNSQRSPTEGAG